MNVPEKSAVHWSFWAISGFCLVWNLMGVGAYMAEFSDEFMASLPDAERALREQRPAWATAALAIAVWGGSVGCLLLLLRKRIAFGILVASLVGVIVQMYFNLVIAESTVVYGPGEVAMTVMIPVIAAFLVWYSRHAASRGWIG